MLRMLQQPLMILGAIALVIAVVLYVCYYRLEEKDREVSKCRIAGTAMLIVGLVSIGASIGIKCVIDAQVQTESRYSSPFSASRYSSS